MESEHDPRVRDAYQSLLGNEDYERTFWDLITLSAAATTFGPDFDSAWQWQLAAVAQLASAMPPHSFSPTVITNEGAAVLPLTVWHCHAPTPGAKIADFVRALEPTYGIVAYASSSSRKQEQYVLVGTDGFTGREAQWYVEHKRSGPRITAQPTTEKATEGGLLAFVAQALREIHSSVPGRSLERDDLPPAP